VIRSGTDDGTVGALARCVALPPAEFASRHWGRAPLLTRGEHDFTDLLDAAAVDELVSRRGLRTPFLRMAMDGTVLDRGTYTRGGGAGASVNDQVADDLVLTQLADGATLVLQALHRTWPPLIDFGSRLAAELGHPVQINAYVTPPQNRGFAPHYDVHDVFVLQVAGRKHWTIHSPVVTDPIDDQPWEQHRAAVQARAGEPPVIDAVLAPGDTLYLPRGTIHAAQALGETSIHLTVGVHPITRYHLVRHLLQAAQDEPSLRMSLPPMVDLASPDVLAPHLAATVRALAALLETAPVAEQARRIGELLQRQTRPVPLAPLAQLSLADSVDLGTPLRLRAGERPLPTDTSLSTLGRSVALSAAEVEAAKTVVAGAVFTPGSLPGLDPAAALGFARRLLLAGVVTAA